MKKNNAWAVAFWVALFIIIIGFMSSAKNKTKPVDLIYSDFKTNIKAKNISEVKIAPGMITGIMRNEKGELQKFKTIPLDDPNLVKEMEENGEIKFYGVEQNSWFGPLLISWGPIILLILFWLWIFRGMSNGGKQAMSFSKAKAKLVNEGQTKVTFQDVAGCDEAKEELQEVVAFLKNPGKFQKLGGKIPKGVLLVGSPGTGKTLLAKAVAGEAGVPFFSSSGSEFVEMFVGVGASRVRDLFDRGRKSAPCVLFIDEIDAVGRARFAGLGSGNDEREQTLNQLLVEMDGFDTKEGIILISATNRPDVLDSALLRPGRFDRQVVVPRPELKDREQILAVHAKKVKLAKNVDLRIIARRTPGCAGADLANIVNEAALLAARYDQTEVTMKNFEDAIEKVSVGPERKSITRTEEEIKKTAYHEIGHVLVAKMLPGTDPVHKVTIIPRGGAMGYTMQLPEKEKFIYAKKDAINTIAILLGGRAADLFFFGEPTTGAANDISRATQTARKMVIEYGMSDKVGPLTLDEGSSEEVFLGRDISRRTHMSEKLSELVDSEIKRIVDDGLKTASEIIEKNKDIAERLVLNLIERETLDGEEIDKIIKGETLPPYEDAVASGTEKKNESENKNEATDGEKENKSVEDSVKTETVSEQENI